MNPLEKIIKGSFLILMLSILSTGLGYFTRLLLSRLLVPEEYGLVFATLSFIGLLSLATDYGLTGAVTRYIAKFKAEKKEINNVIGTILPIVIFFSIMIGVLIFFRSNVIANSFFHNPKATILLRVSSIFLIIHSIFSVFNSGLAGFKKVEQAQALHTLKKGIDMGMVYWLTLGFGVFGAFLGYTFSLLIITGLGFLLLFRTFPNLLKFKFSLSFLKEAFKFGLPVWIATLSNYGLAQGGVLLLTYLTSTTIVGLYQTALPTALTFGAFASAISSISFPIFSELFAKQDEDNIIKTLRFLLKWIFLLIIPVVGILFVFSRPVIVILFGSRYAEAALALRILSLLILPASFVTVLKTIVDSSGRTKETMRAFLIGAGVNIGLSILLIPYLGMIGTALALLIAYLLMSWILVDLIGKIIRIRVPLADWGKGMIVTGIMILTLATLKGTIQPLLLQVTILGLIGFGIYLAGLVLAKVFSEEDRDLLKSLIKFDLLKK